MKQRPSSSLLLPLLLAAALIALADFRRSDHAPFWEAGYPAVQITDTANFRYPNSHCDAGPDAVTHLDTTMALKVTQAVAVAGLRRLRVQ